METKTKRWAIGLPIWLLSCVVLGTWLEVAIPVVAFGGLALGIKWLMEQYII